MAAPNSKKILIVTGAYSEDGGKASYFGQEIYMSFASIIEKDITFLNGGKLDLLDTHFSELEQYSVIFWMPHIDNSVDKYLPLLKAKNKTAFLIQSKRNDHHNYTTFQVVERMFKAHSNLCLEITKNAPSAYYFRILDPLGNLWYSGSSINSAANKIARIVKCLSKLTRMPSVDTLTYPNNAYVDDSFIDAVKFYGWRFSNLLNTAINKERFLGNVSTRCMIGFPSERKKDFIFVSRRNVNKEDITSDHFVPVSMGQNEVLYYGAHKPSVDTPTQLKLYEYYHFVRYIIHGHTYIKDAPFTKKYVPCGYLEEATEIIALFPDHLTHNVAINLIGHGCIILAKDISYFAELGMVSRDFPERLDDHLLEDLICPG